MPEPLFQMAAMIATYAQQYDNNQYIIHGVESK
jgi:hypothetical protein